MNGISITRLEDLWQQQIKQDFPEAEKNDQMEMSNENHQFMKMRSEPLKSKAIQMQNNSVVAEQRALNL